MFFGVFFVTIFGEPKQTVLEGLGAGGLPRETPSIDPGSPRAQKLNLIFATTATATAIMQLQRQRLIATATATATNPCCL